MPFHRLIAATFKKIDISLPIYSPKIFEVDSSFLGNKESDFKKLHFIDEFRDLTPLIVAYINDLSEQ